jgi:hypothetical protein
MTELSGNPPAAEQLLMKTLAQITRVLGMTDEAWQRHANPWSVYTRFAAIPAMILAIWSRVWSSWWALVPVGGVIIWLWLNPFVFPAVTMPRQLGSKGNLWREALVARASKRSCRISSCASLAACSCSLRWSPGGVGPRTVARMADLFWRDPHRASSAVADR